MPEERVQARERRG